MSAIEKMISSVSEETINAFCREHDNGTYRSSVKSFMRGQENAHAFFPATYKNVFKSFTICGYSENLNLFVFLVRLDANKSLSERSCRRLQFDYAKSIMRKDHGNYLFHDALTNWMHGSIPFELAQAIFVFADDFGRFRFSLVENLDAKEECSKRFRRYTFYIDQKATNRTFKDRMDGRWTSFEEVKKAFSVERLSDEFFDEYKEIYQRFVEYATGKRMVKQSNTKWVEIQTHPAKTEIMDQFSVFGDGEKAFRDYVKKMMGRLVFLQFLQKKGWLGVPAGQDWGKGDKEYMKNLFESKTSTIQEDFLDMVLEPLFFDSLNTNRSQNGDLAAAILSITAGQRVRIPYLNGGLFEKDALDGTKVKFPAEYFAGLFDTFERFNFTIDENDPEDAEIGVDPEMLGRIFENLLEDNKDKGAFYTPKEIVRYMCQESLIQYLGENPAIRKLVTEFDDKDIPEEQKADLIEKLKTVKVCDPAIGSGAFPMGMLNLLYHLRIKLGDIEDSSQGILKAKKEIIQNNIYGVDIEAGAVDIARLRFWLSIVVDEDIPTPLPNFDYKIMQGNSLLEQYNDVDLKLDLRPTNKKGKKINSAIVDPQPCFEWDDEVKALETVKRAMSDFFTPSPGEDKNALRHSIDMAVKNYIKTKCGNDPKVNGDVDSMNLNNKPFFLWHLYFADVFTEHGGFDIVIGNPPYNELRDLTIPQQKLYKKSDFFKDAEGGRINLFQFFYPLGFSLGTEYAIISLITQNSLLGEDSALNNRKLIFSSGEILKIDSFPERDNVHKRVFESAKMSVCIANIQKKSSISKNHNFIVNVWADRFFSSCKVLNINLKKIQSIYPESLIIPITSKIDFDLVFKIATNPGEKIKVNCSAGEIDMTKYKHFFSTQKDSNSYRVITGAQIQRYYITNTPSQGKVIYLGKDTLQKLSIDRQKAISKNRIIMQRITGVDSLRRIIATQISASNFCANSTNYLSIEDINNNKFILGILNSKLFNWFLKQTSTNTNITSSVIEKFPFIDASSTQKKRISEFVDSLLSESDNERRIDIENQLDVAIYDLYSLNTLERLRIESIYLKNTKESNIVYPDSKKAKNQLETVINDDEDARE